MNGREREEEQGGGEKRKKQRFNQEEKKRSRIRRQQRMDKVGHIKREALIEIQKLLKRKKKFQRK